MSNQLIQFEQVLFDPIHPIINIQKLLELCFCGIPDVLGLRSLCWKLLLGYLPPDRRKWVSVLETQRKVYAEFVKDIIDDPKFKECGKSSVTSQIRVDVDRTLPDISLFHKPIEILENGPTTRCNTGKSTASSHTLATKEEEQPSLDTDDLRRRLTELICDALIPPNYFEADNTDIPLSVQTHCGLSSCLMTTPKTHAQALSRILLVHARFNRGAGYTQGMNEILAPIYYVLAMDHLVGSPRDSEADSFHMFILALRGVHLDMFISAMDTLPIPSWHARSKPSYAEQTDLLVSAFSALPSPGHFPSIIPAYTERPQSSTTSLYPTNKTGGLQHTLKYWWLNSVKTTDNELWTKLNALGIQPEHFALRWVLVWGAREFTLPDVIQLWDALMANSARITRYTKPAQTSQLHMAFKPQATDTETIIPTGAFRSVKFVAGKQQCDVRIAQDVSGDDEDLSELGFLFDFFTTVLIAIREHIMKGSFEQCMEILQRLPRDSLDIRDLLRKTLVLRQRRSCDRIIRACCGALAVTSRPEPLSAIPGSAACSEDNGNGITRLFGQITNKLRMLSPDFEKVNEHPCCVLVSQVSKHRVQIMEVTGYNSVSNTATLCLIGECDASVPSLNELSEGVNKRIINLKLEGESAMVKKSQSESRLVPSAPSERQLPQLVKRGASGPEIEEEQYWWRSIEDKRSKPVAVDIVLCDYDSDE